MAKKVTFKSNYDHKWQSRAVTAYKAGWSGTVKDEVAEAAEKAGVLEGKPENAPSGAKTATTKSDTDGTGGDKK